MTAAHPIRILVVDDHTLFRRGLIALLAGDERFQVVAEAQDAGEACRCAAAYRPDLVLLDNHLPGVSGVAALPDLRAAAPQARVLMLTMSEDERDMAAALRGGASGYLLKTIDSAALAEAIVRAMKGVPAISPEMTGKLVNAFQSLQAGGTEAGIGPSDAPARTAPPAARDPIDDLSPRERQILSQIARGSSNKEIARTLDIAEATVKIHVQHILRKLNLGSRVQAAVYAAERGR
ncbi:MAG: response regulator [Burkholderiaceae bacterium]